MERVARPWQTVSTRAWCFLQMAGPVPGPGMTRHSPHSSIVYLARQIIHHTWNHMHRCVQMNTCV
jgi:hypothetical protein